MNPPDLGLRFIVEPSSFRLSDDERVLLQDLRPAGVMFRRRNFVQDSTYEIWMAEYSNLLGEIRQAIGRPNLLITIDHEGGRVHRFPPPITRFPYPAFYASSDDAIESVTKAMATELSSLGINVSCSPVADIHSNPSNPVINQRSFGRTVDEVTKRAALCAKTLRQNGILPCGKHFPGHGDTGIDSHFALPVLQKSRAELLEMELLPFKELIKNEIPILMTAHILLPQLDTAFPATLSPIILRDLLRTELGFKGVVVADALGMQAIRGLVEEKQFSDQATRAGVDLLLFVGDPISIADAVSCRDNLAVQLSESEELLVLHQESEGRVRQLMQTLPSYPVSLLPADTLESHATLAATLSNHAEWEEFVLNIPGYD